MNIYSIKEILKATNNFLDSDSQSKKKNIKEKLSDKIPINTQKIIADAEMMLTLNKEHNKNVQAPLVLNNEIPSNEKIKQFNYKIKIKSEIKDLMINELYIYLKKKLKKNTLKLIIEEQLEKKNLQNKINFLYSRENKLTIEFQELKKNYKSALGYNRIFKIENDKLKNNLDQALMIKNEIVLKNEQLQTNLNALKKSLDESILKNTSFEINNNELKNTVSRYITNYKKLQNEFNELKDSKNLQFEDEFKKIKFYQDENIRLSTELLLSRKKNETIKLNLNDIELEKQKISNKINELNNSITGKSNIISPNILKETPKEPREEIQKLDDKEQKSLDEVINKIFSKI